MITIVEKEWGLSTRVIKSEKLTAQLYDIVSRKTQEAQELGLTVPLYCAVTYYVTHLCAPIFGAQLLQGPRGEFTVVFSNQEGPALAFESKENSSKVTIHYTGRRPDYRLIRKRVRGLKSSPLLSPETYPYGFVEEGRITTLLFTAEYEYDDEREQFLGGEPYVYVLEGASMPSELCMTKNDVTWSPRVTRMIQSGQLIPLRRRIHKLPGEVWSCVNESGRYITFDESDGQIPAFVTDAPYLHWHPREAYPGELFDFGEKPRKLRLRRWLSW